MATREMRDNYKDLFTGEYVSHQKRQVDASLPLVPLMQQAGVEVLTGTDMGSSLLAPGFSLHDEIAHLVDCGLKPIDYHLPASTSNSMDILWRISEGGIQPARPALVRRRRTLETNCSTSWRSIPRLTASSKSS